MDKCVNCYLEDKAHYCKDKIVDPLGGESCFWYRVVNRDLKIISDYNAGKNVPMFNNKPCTTFNLDDLITRE